MALLSDVVVIFFISIVVLTPNGQFLIVSILYLVSDMVDKTAETE
jgi:hypothetical protein